MQEPHFFEIVGTVLVRGSGRRNQVTECVVVRTMARRQYDSTVQFVELTSGSDTYVVGDWFHDWDNERDNHTMTEDGDFGRHVDIAIPREDYELINNAHHVPAGIVAVKVDGKWRTVTMLNEKLYPGHP